MTKISNLYSLTNYIDVNSNGNVVIATPTSGFALDVTGTGRFTGALTAAQLFAITSSNVVGGINSTNSTGGYLTWSTNGTIIADIGTEAQIFGSGSGTTFGINARGAQNLVLGTNNTVRFILDSNGAATFTKNVTIGQAAAATNIKLIFNGVASKAAGIEFQQSGTPQWYIGNGIASEDNNFELYNSNGTMAMKIIKSTNAIAFQGATTFNSSVTASGNINAGTSSAALQANGYQVAKYSYFGYSSGYPGIIIGNTGGQTLFFNVDISGNPSGAFNGGGQEYVWRNAGSFITPNASNNGYNTLFGWNSSGSLTVNQAATFSASVKSNTFFSAGTGSGKFLGVGSDISGGFSASDFVLWNTGGDLYLYATGAAGMIVKASSGNVAIGTTTIQQASANRTVTTINGTTSAILNLATSDALRVYLYADSSGSTFETVGTNTISANSNNIISFTTNGGERMRITGLGNFDYGGFNVQHSNNATYRQAFYGALSIMWRNGEDAYLNSNTTYSSSNTDIATYTSSNGIGRATIGGGTFEWASFNGSVTAGSAYSLTRRFSIGKQGYVEINSVETGLRINTGSGQNALSIGGVGEFRMDYPGVGGGRFRITDSGRIFTGSSPDSPYNRTTGSAGNLFVDFDGSLYRGTGSSQRFKDNITDWSASGLDTILALKPKTFTYKEDYYSQPQREFLGLIAEEVAEVSPYLADYRNEDGTGQIENVKYATIVVPLIKAIQELSAKVTALENK
jgi:hypothetical protein